MALFSFLSEEHAGRIKWVERNSKNIQKEAETRNVSGWLLPSTKQLGQEKPLWKDIDRSRPTERSQDKIMLL